MDSQRLLFALDTQTSDKIEEHISNLKAKPSVSFSKYWEESNNQKFQYLDLRTSETSIPNNVAIILQGAPTSLNASECPTTPITSYLSNILQTDPVPNKYHLSSQACAGILRRATSRGKELPDILKTTLENQVKTPLNANGVQNEEVDAE